MLNNRPASSLKFISKELSMLKNSQLQSLTTTPQLQAAVWMNCRQVDFPAVAKAHWMCLENFCFEGFIYCSSNAGARLARRLVAVHILVASGRQ